MCRSLPGEFFCSRKDELHLSKRGMLIFVSCRRGKAFHFPIYPFSDLELFVLDYFFDFLNFLKCWASCEIPKIFKFSNFSILECLEFWASCEIC